MRKRKGDNQKEEETFWPKKTPLKFAESLTSEGGGKSKKTSSSRSSQDKGRQISQLGQRGITKRKRRAVDPEQFQRKLSNSCKSLHKHVTILDGHHKENSWKRREKSKQQTPQRGTSGLILV